MSIPSLEIVRRGGDWGEGAHFFDLEVNLKMERLIAKTTGNRQIIKKMFNITPEVSDEQSLEQQGREHSFQYTMKSEDLEDTSILQFKRLCTNHIRHMTPELDNRMAVIMGKKMPRNTGMALEFETRTLKESPDKNDTVAKCLKRIKLILQEKREHIRLSNEAGPDEYCSVIDDKDKVLSNAAPKSRGYTPLIIKCQACGMTNHARKQCAFKHHELANNTSLPWDNSTKRKKGASHGKSHLTIGYTIPGYPAIQHSDGIYPKPNPYAKSHYQSNSSTGRYRQDNTNNYNHDQNNNNYNRDHNNNNYNRDNNNNNRDNSVGRFIILFTISYDDDYD
jgi:hypothetical protein